MTQRIGPAPDEATARQNLAATPGNHVWVSANAGSGKTRVLINRVARLLLADVPPQNILCLTYTKAAASEMQNRLFGRLGEWAMLPDAPLMADLAELGAEGPFDSEALAKARRLFARAIETPGGLRIQTIHAFCASVLRRFPLEARVSPQFQEMDDRAGDLLREEIMTTLARERPDLLGPVTALHNGEGFDRFAAQIARTDGFARPPDPAALARAVGLPQNAGPDMVFDLAWQGGETDLCRRISDAFSDQSASYKTFAAQLAGLSHDAPGEADLAELFRLFLYAKDQTSKSRNFPQANHTKAVEAAEPIVDELHDWMDRVAEAWDLRCAVALRDRSLALHALGHAFAQRYEETKEQNARLDFDDLITRTLTLLDDKDVAQWVLFKLDGGIDHILVDEAQDTSPDQWAVIRRLTEEFASGEGARADVERTLFVVGDKKQSIYSFQGADPEAFDAMRRHFGTRLAEVQDRLHDVPLSHSFRSSAAVLDCVDQTFVGEDADGVEEDLSHIAFKADMPGRVDLWPVVETDDEKQPDQPWFIPLDRPAKQDPKVHLAEKIATRIRQMIDQGTLIPSKRHDDGTWEARPMTEGDVLILVRRRSGIFGPLIRACKAKGLNIAGADRLKLGGELAVKDIAAVLRFLALPEDDLSLAEALRSPLLGWSEQDLFSLAHPRPRGQSLWEALRKGAKAYPETLAFLDDLRKQADFLRPFDLIDRILNRWAGRDRLLARLGSEAEDGIDALLSQALSYEQNTVPSLTGFLGWMQSDDVEIKRQMDAEGDRLRVMTVHGAKGLEAPVVILPDCDVPDWSEKDAILELEGLPVWKPNASAMPSALRDEVEARKDRKRREWRRLLYVAMTRAENWLIVAAAGKAGQEGESWFRLAEAGLERLGARPLITPTGGGLRHQVGRWEDMLTGQAKAKAPVTPVDLPPFTPVAEVAALQTRSPSDLGGAKVLPGEPSDGEDGDLARARGTLLHRLLEHLPKHPPENRAAVADQLAQSLNTELPLSIRREVIADAQRLLLAPDLAEVFGPGSLAEVSLNAAFGETRLHGAIDRLVIGPKVVLAVDYKSNRIIPETPDQTPEGLLRQMGAYDAMLRQVYPGKQIETAILWTGAARLMRLPGPLVSAALDRVMLA